MTPALIKAGAVSLTMLVLGACSAVEDVVAYGKGPFDHGPIPRSETALEGLHESSWGNSGKWGAKEASEGDEQSDQNAAEKPPQ